MEFILHQIVHFCKHNQMESFYIKLSIFANVMKWSHSMLNWLISWIQINSLIHFNHWFCNCSVSNSRTARRNDKYLASWAEVYRPFKKRKKNKNRKKKPENNSPITYIKLPATPYNYVQGEGYLSQPATQGNSLMNFLSSVMLSKAPKEVRSHFEWTKVD